MFTPQTSKTKPGSDFLKTESLTLPVTPLENRPTTETVSETANLNIPKVQQREKTNLTTDQEKEFGINSFAKTFVQGMWNNITALKDFALKEPALAIGIFTVSAAAAYAFPTIALGLGIVGAGVGLVDILSGGKALASAKNTQEKETAAEKMGEGASSIFLSLIKTSPSKVTTAAKLAERTDDLLTTTAKYSGRITEILSTGHPSAQEDKDKNNKTPE